MNGTGRTQYVLGFVFNPEQTAVVLRLKAKPAWQKGYLNGIGGKVEPEETATEAMVRECQEETGLETATGSWRLFLLMHGPEFAVHCFVTVMGRLEMLETQEPEEPLCVMPLTEIPRRRREMIGNLPWIIFLGMDFLNDANLSGAEVAYV